METKKLKREFEKIFDKAQASASTHQKCVIMLSDLYRKTPFDVFCSLLITFLNNIIFQSKEKDIYIKRSLEFISRFCSEITILEEKNNEPHDLFTSVIEDILQWSNVNNYDIRYHSCSFIAMLLQDIGEEVQLETNLIDEIQNVMLAQMQEGKVLIRLQAINALVRLQDPLNFKCPVVQAYLTALSNPAAQIRKAALERIAPNMTTLSKIRDRVGDVDAGVRAVAFQRCANIGPVHFGIADRHHIMMSGFRETDEKVKNKFFDFLLPKWLTAYTEDYLKFVGGLKLSSDEEDIEKMVYLTTELIKEFFKKHPIESLVSALPINDQRLIDLDKLTNDVTLFWNVLSGLMRDADHMDEYLDRILPDLTPFCHYIEGIIEVKTAEKMDEWKTSEFQFDLLNLLEIAKNYDFSDEVGRRTMQSLAVKTLQENNFQLKITKILVEIAEKCSSNVEFFTNDMCQLISEVNDKMGTKALTEDQSREQGFKAAELRVKLNILNERQDQAVEERNYDKAQELSVEIANINKQLKDLQKPQVTKSDHEILCYSLDILNSVLELPVISKLTPSLIACKDDFLVPLITNSNALIHSKVLKCLTLFSLVDRAIAAEYAKLICVPIATYRTVPISNVSALSISLRGITDLITAYGIKIVSPDEEALNDASNQNGKRKLYSSSSEDDTNGVTADNITLSCILEVFVDMLDDEREEIRHNAVFAIAALLRQFKMTPSILSRICLKWFNPLTAKNDSFLGVNLGYLIEEYLRNSSGEVVKEAIIPTLTSIFRAPRNSPLVDIDIDNVSMFFAQILNVKEEDNIRIMILDICMKISENPKDNMVPLLTKFLCHLDLKQINEASLPELIQRTEILLEDLSDKTPRSNIEKFIFKLKQVQTKENQATGKQTKGNSDKEKNAEASNADKRQTLEQSVQVKRKKRNTVASCVVVLEKLDLNKHTTRNNTTLPSLPEVVEEMDIDENLNIEEDKSTSSKQSKTSRASTVIITETSDSDFSHDSEIMLRRSNRSRKKRIIA